MGSVEEACLGEEVRTPERRCQVEEASQDEAETGRESPTLAEQEALSPSDQVVEDP